MGGTQSLHTNAYDEALGLPTERSATIALRTQQILAAESGLTDTVDPLAGSYYVESLTDRLEEAAGRIIYEVDRLGGAVSAIERGFPQREIEEASYRASIRVESGQDTVVGVNRFTDDTGVDVEALSVDPALEAAQRSRVRAWRADRDRPAVDRSLERLSGAARGTGNIMYPMKDALAAGATLGEVSDALRGVFGVHRAR